MAESSLPRSSAHVVKLAPRQRPGAWRVPAALTPMFGRDADIATVVGMLDSQGVRLVTLLGPGGIGKTRLGLAIAAKLADAFADGACFVGLGPLQDGSMLEKAVADALGFQESGVTSAGTLVASTLADRHVLLLLDNVEHLVDAVAPWVGELLQQCPRVRILATSRVPVGLGGERRLVVQPLSLPDADALDIELLAESAAIALFVERARAVRHDFALDNGNARPIREICRALDGVPLAIEIAASHLRLLSPSALRDRILVDGRVSLVSDRRDIPDRHRTMRNAIVWSYDLLSPEQQRLFRRLAVFTGGFNIDVATAVAEEDAGLETVSSLVDHSLIRRVHEGDASVLEMLEPIREFALEQLEASGETTIARDLHAEWYLTFARESDAILYPARQIDALRQLADEHDNIRGAIAWLVERGKIEDALDLAGSLWFFFWIRGHYSEGRETYERLLAHPLAAERTTARGKALNGLGLIALHQGDVERSRAAHAEATAIFGEVGEREYHLWAHLSLGVVYLVSDRHAEGVRIHEEGYRLAREIGFVHAVQAVSGNFGTIATERGDLAEARRWFQTSVEMSEEIGAAWGKAIALMNLSEINLREGHVEAAEHEALEALDLTRALGDRRDIPLLLSLLATIARSRGDLSTARQYLEDGLVASRAIGDAYTTASILVELAALSRRLGERDRALALAREAIDAQVRMNSPLAAMKCLDTLAELAVEAGDGEQAARFIGAVDAALQQEDVLRWEALSGQHEDRVRSAIATVGERRYKSAWHSGHALSVEEALEEGRRYSPPRRPASGSTDRAVSGSVILSPRELEVLRLMADGLTNQEIADRLYVSHRTATSHTSSIIGKLGVTTRTAAVAYAIRNGLA